MNVYIGQPIVVSNMQGPCPDGFHVPTIKEWNTVLNYYLYAKYGRNIDIDTLISYNDWNNGGYDGASLLNYLLLPKAGLIDGNGQHNQRGSYGYYWASTGSATANFNMGNALRIWRENQFSTDTLHRAGYGDSIRPFKDTAVVPDSTWTSLYSNKIYHNSTLGLISISADGNDWITIADKNLGATTVYSDGDTLSESNCGKFYQRGNNYGFAFTGPTTTSTTKVNAQSFGPGNYYSSSTFIIDSTYNYWDSSMNLNLRGGVSQGTSTKSTEVSNIYIGEYVPDFATRGPAPKGFHVPLSSEWSSLYTIMSGLGLSSGDKWRINLHMPFAGHRDYSYADLYNQGSDGYYWSSSPYGSDKPNSARYLYLDSSRVSASYYDYRAYGFSVRCFKDSYVTPDSSWTVVQGTLGSAGIFWNQTEGLISITNGTIGYTIQDKNLGATAVYNNGDTLSQANMGNFYQWGNNYGFPSTGSVSKTSSTQVDASGYGPGNYYENDTFIARSSSPYNRDSSKNDNLRGGEDGNVPVS